MPYDSESNIATADALTLLLHNQHALGAAIEEVTKWFSENGAERVAENAVVAMETLDTNAKAINEVILRLRTIVDGMRSSSRRGNSLLITSPQASRPDVLNWCKG